MQHPHIKALSNYFDRELNGGDLPSMAAGNAIDFVLQCWDDHLADVNGKNHELLEDVDELIEKLQAFRAKARVLLKE